MVELICMSEGCQFNRIISNLEDILPHLNGQHKLLEIDQFEKQFKEIQLDVNNVERIQNIFFHIIDTVKKQLSRLNRLFEDRLTILTQNLKSHKLYQLKEFTVLESITKFSQLNQIKEDKIAFENSLLKYTEEYFDDLAVQFDQMSEYVQEYDDLVQGVIKQQGQLIEQPIPQRTVTQIQVINTQFETQRKQHDFQPAYNNSDNNQNQDVVFKPLRGYKNDQQYNSEQVFELLVPRGINQQIDQIKSSQECMTTEPNRFQNNAIKESGLVPLRGYKNQSNNHDNQTRQELASKTPSNINSEPIKQRQKQPKQLDQITSKTQKVDKGKVAQPTQNVKTKVPETSLEKVTFIIKEQVIQTLVKQVRFDRNLSQKQLEFKNDYAEAIIGEEQYLICDQSFKINAYSKLDILIAPNRPEIEVKIGLICLNRWNDHSKEQYKKNQKTTSKKLKPILYLELLKINVAQKINMKLQNKQLEYTYITKIKDLNLESFQDTDDMAFFIEGKQCKIMIQ